MTIKGMMLKFFLVYTVLLILAAMLMSYFGIRGSTGVNFAILAGAVLWVCGDFGKKNSRYFSKQEKTMVVSGFIAIDLLLQVVFGAAVLSQAPTGVDVGAFVFVVGFVTLLHALTIYLFVGAARKILVKQGAVRD
jgi:hypothetical protein